MEKLQAALAHRYALERELGSGGMATVWLARDLKHDRWVALKVLRPDLAATLGPERFLREIRVTARLDHPHILPVLDSGEAAELLWYTMPYVRGETLRERLRREVQLPVEVAVDLTRQVAAALECAHREGVVHRDLKPENILLSDGQARVADFGVATALAGNGEPKLTETGLAVGTPAYMSPEQASGGAVDARSDVYALGCVLYEMLAGEPPFTGPTAQVVIARRLTEAPRSLSAIRERIPRHLEDVVSRALARTPVDRFHTAADLAAALATESGTRSGALSTSVPELPTAQSGGRSLVRPRLPQVLTLALGLLLTVSIGVLIWQRGRQANMPRPKPPGIAVEATGPADSLQPSVAVLPFANLSPDRDNEYFSDGMTEELISALARVEGLRVAARASSFAFKGQPLDVAEVSRKLNVGAVLDGSVRRSGTRLRVTAELVDAHSGRRIWADRYDRELRDVFQVQDELARAIAGALRVPLRLDAKTNTAIVRVATGDPAAHDLYLQGRFFWNQRTYESLRTAARYFERAIARDSSYAEAHAALGDTYGLYPIYGLAVPREAYPKAKSAAMRALALDSTLGSAHATLGVVRENYDWDWEGAEREFQHAIALDPSYATAHQWYAEYLSSLGRFERALVEAERAVTLDPLSRVIRADKAGVLIRSRRYDEAIAELRRTVDLDPGFMPAHNYLGWAYLAKRMYTDAVAQLDTTVRLSGGRSGIGRLAYAYGFSGQRKRTLELIQELSDRSRQEYVTPFSFALAYVGADNKDQAIAWLERGAEMRDPSIVSFLLTDPLLDTLRSDPRFGRLLVRIGLK